MSVITGLVFSAESRIPLRTVIVWEPELPATSGLADLLSHPGGIGEVLASHAGPASGPDSSLICAEAHRQVIDKPRALEFGTGAAATAMTSAIARLKRKYDLAFLIGGCW